MSQTGNWHPSGGSSCMPRGSAQPAPCRTVQHRPSSAGWVIPSVVRAEIVGCGSGSIFSFFGADWSGNQTWLAGKSTRNEGVNTKIICKYDGFSLEMKVSIRKSSVNMTDFPFPCWRTRGSVKTWGFWRLRGQSTNIPLLPKLFQFQIWINLDIFYWITRSKDIWKVIPHYCYCKYDFTFLSFLGVAVPPGTRSPSRTARSAAWSLPAWRWQAGTFLWWLKQRWSRHFNNCKSSILSLNFCLVTLVTWCIMMILPPKMVSEKFGTCHIAKHGLSMHKHGLSMGWWAPMASILVPQRSTKWDGRVGNGCLLRISTSRSPDNR